LADELDAEKHGQQKKTLARRSPLASALPAQRLMARSSSRNRVLDGERVLESLHPETRMCQVDLVAADAPTLGGFDRVLQGIPRDDRRAPRNTVDQFCIRRQKAVIRPVVEAVAGRTDVTFVEWDSCVTAGACPKVSDNGWAEAIGQ
jgi:hypothetical protein